MTINAKPKLHVVIEHYEHYHDDGTRCSNPYKVYGLRAWILRTLSRILTKREDTCPRRHTPKLKE
jgi:hypothetical protein